MKYSIEQSTIHRKDTENFPVTNFAEQFPAKFMDSQIFREARESAAVLPSDVRVSYLLSLRPLQLSHFFSVPEHNTGL